MALPTTPTYSTVAEFNLYTPVTAQKTMAEADWKPFALRAEAILDSYVTVPTCQRYDEDQDLAFPIEDEDGNSLIPNDVIRAHIEITSDLILKGDPTAEDGTISLGEAWSSSQYSASKAKKAGSDSLKIEMPALARRLLLPWNSSVTRLTY